MSGIPDPDWCKYCQGWQLGGFCTTETEAAECPSPGVRKKLRKEREKRRKSQISLSETSSEKRRKKVNPPPDG